MATDLERLVVSLEASITKYEKTMARAAGVADTRAKQIEKRFSLTESKLANFGKTAFKGFASGAIGALAGVVSVTAAINGAKAALDKFGDIADNAKASGLGTDFFQSVAYQAELAGVAYNELSAALATFNKNSGLATAGKGRMVTALKALNPELLENIRAATTQEDRIKLVADALSTEADASKRAAIATAAFGDAGLKLVDAFSGGAQQIEEMRRKAQDLGVIVDRGLIAKAEELGDEFDTVTKIVDLQLKQALVGLGPPLVWVLQLLNGVIAGTADAFRQINDFAAPGDAQVSTKGLEAELAALDRLYAEAHGKVFTVGGEEQAALGNQMQNWLDRMNVIRSELDRREGAGVPAAPPSDIPTLDEIDNRNEAAAAAIKQAEAVKQLIADLQFEQSILGMSAEEQDILNTLRRAGVEATSAQGQEIRGLIEAINAEKVAQDAVNDALEQQAELARSAGAALAEALRDGKIEGQELLGILVDVGRQMALSGLSKLNEKGGGGNIFTNVLSGLLGGFASGTANTGGARGEVRGLVHGQEAVIPLPGGGKVPVDIRLPSLAGAASQKVVNNVYNYSSEPVEQRQNPSGGIDVIVGAVEQRIRGNMARGQYRQFGVGPGTVRR